MNEIETFIQQQLKVTTQRPLIVGLSGPQGSGKTTLTTNLQLVFKEQGIHLITLSLDDYYLTHKQQQQLYKETANPLYEYRGNPGTHDLSLLAKSINACKDGNLHSLYLPKYDKSLHGGKGDRLPESLWTCVNKPPDIVLIEGWCLGFKSIHPLPPLKISYEIQLKTNSELPLNIATNNVSRDYDQSHLAQINTAILNYQTEIYTHFDAFIALGVLNIQIVHTWRHEQEVISNGNKLTALEVTAFVNRFMPAYQIYYKSMLENGINGKPGTFLLIMLDQMRNVISSTVK